MRSPVPPAATRACPQRVSAYPESFLCDAGLSQKIVENRMTRKHEETPTLTRADLRQAVYDCCPSLSRENASKMLDGFFEELSSTLRILRRIAKCVGESFHERGWNFHAVRRIPQH